MSPHILDFVMNRDWVILKEGTDKWLYFSLLPTFKAEMYIGL